MEKNSSMRFSKDHGDGHNLKVTSIKSPTGSASKSGSSQNAK